ncbi:hypothetical protein HZ326_19683 [Fusarium oxysporum f. sp. albedinis]|nr:hypothetical protein HZ326_19683 [Fusarium oxysporum f. sp. albedinis]
MLRDKRHLGRALRRSRIRGWSVLSLCCVATRQNLKKFLSFPHIGKTLQTAQYAQLTTRPPRAVHHLLILLHLCAILLLPPPPKYVPGCEQGRTARSYGLLG